MQVSFSRDFSQWAQQDKFLEKLEVTRELARKRYTSEHIKQIRALGMPAKSLALLYGMMREYCETGFACFSHIRFLCWFWENGDKIVFPLNSNNQIYLGNDSSSWLEYWPFLKKTSINSYRCDLPEFTEPQPTDDEENYVLGLGGQSHFGHFVANRVAALHQSNLAYPYISTLNTILVPIHYLELHKLILSAVLGGKPKKFHDLPCEAGIYTFKNTVIPCIDEHYNAITGLQGVIEKNSSNRLTKKDKRVYITRAVQGVNDRLIGFKKFAVMLESLDFEILNPTNLTFSDRLNLIGDSEFILTDSGSCSLNGLLFSNKCSSVRQMLTTRVISTIEESIINQLCMGFNQGVQGQWLIVDSAILSTKNPWYDICFPPSIHTIKKLLSL